MVDLYTFLKMPAYGIHFNETQPFVRVLIQVLYSYFVSDGSHFQRTEHGSVLNTVMNNTYIIQNVFISNQHNIIVNTT